MVNLTGLSGVHTARNRCNLVCGVTRRIEASHTGPHGLAQKSSDYTAIPLCVKHHRTARDSYHRLGPRKFAETHNLDIPAIVQRLNAKPNVRIEAGRFVGYFDQESYVLGDVKSDAEGAVKKVIRLYCSTSRPKITTA